jgi:hypothetical protein
MTQWRNGQMNWTELFQKKIFKWLKNIEKMINIPGHKGNENQNHIKISPTPVRMTTIENTNNNKCWWVCRKKGTFIQCWWEYKLVQPPWKTVWRVLKKLQIELSYDPTISLLRIYLKDCELAYNKVTCTPRFIDYLQALSYGSSQ